VEVKEQLIDNEGNIKGEVLAKNRHVVTFNRNG